MFTLSPRKQIALPMTQL